MSTAPRFLISIRALGHDRLRLLGVLTAGHFAIHWFQQFYPVLLPGLKSGLNLTNVQVGALTSAQQVVVGLGQLPFGMVADSLVRHRGAILALSLVSMGAAYFCLGVPHFTSALLGSALIGLGTALWHPTAAAIGQRAWAAFQAGARDDLWMLAPKYYRASAAEEKNPA